MYSFKVKVSSLGSSQWQHAVPPCGILFLSLEFHWSSMNGMGRAGFENWLLISGETKVIETF